MSASLPFHLVWSWRSRQLYGLGRFGAKSYVGVIVSLSLVRELGPILTALMVGGRVGSGITAEIGAMNVTEQIDAIKALGANPVKNSLCRELQQPY